MWPYILVILIIFILQFKSNNKEKEKCQFYIGVIILFFFAAFRGVSNGDYTAYLKLGKEVDSVHKIFNNNTHMEIGYSILYYFINLFHFPEQSIIIAMNLISLYFVTKFINQYSLNKNLSLLLFLPLYFQFDMHAARTAVAISISTIGITYVLQRHIFKFCIAIFFATLFHSSAAIVLPIYFFMNININLFIGVITILGSMCYVYFVGLDKTVLLIFQKLNLQNFYVRYYHYVNDNDFGYRFSLIDPRLLYCIFIYIISKKVLKKATRIENFFINCSLANVLIMILFSEHTIFACRLSAFYNIYSIILVPIILKKVYISQIRRDGIAAIKSNKEIGLIMAVFFTLYAVSYAYVCFIALGLEYKLFV